MASNNNKGDDSNLLDLFVKQVLPILGAVGGVAAILYATGFFITNISLLTFGVYKTGLLRERFVAAGIAFILLLAILLAVAIGVLKLINKPKEWINRDKAKDEIKKTFEDSHIKLDPKFVEGFLYLLYWIAVLLIILLVPPIILAFLIYFFFFRKNFHYLFLIVIEFYCFLCFFWSHLWEE